MLRCVISPSFPTPAVLMKIGTHADNAEFRDMLNAEQKATTTLTRNIMTHVKEQRIRGVMLGQFEREYRRFAQLIEKVEIKQKQQLLAVSQKEHNPIAEEITREEAATGRAGSFVQSALPAESEIEFL